MNIPMFTVEQLKEMFVLQENLERHISGDNWRDQGHDYALCVHMECAEIIDHYGWKHWKKQDPPNVDVIAMEIVDVWHFCLAYILEKERKLSFEELAEKYWDHLQKAVEMAEKEDFIESCIGMSFSMYAMNQVPLGNLIAIMEEVGLDFVQLYILYISKNVLNRFRQDKGYKTGEYAKIWGNKEDNEHLMDACRKLHEAGELSAESLYESLELKYRLSGR